MYVTEKKHYGEVEYFKAIFKNRIENNMDTEPFAIWRNKYVRPTNNVYMYANIHTYIHTNTDKIFKYP